MRILTIGHSNRSENQVLYLLQNHAVSLVLDVWSYPGSEHFPSFNMDIISDWLNDAGIGYLLMKNLGGRRRSQGIDPAINGGWTNPAFHNYADYTLSEEWSTGMDVLKRLAYENSIVALMCAEAVPWRCHRTIIADNLVHSGVSVSHITGATDPIEHVLGSWGPRPNLDSSVVTYPKANLT